MAATISSIVVCSDFGKQQQYEAAGNETYGRETGGINGVLPQGQPAENGIGRKRNQGKGRTQSSAKTGATDAIQAARACREAVF